MKNFDFKKQGDIKKKLIIGISIAVVGFTIIGLATNGKNESEEVNDKKKTEVSEVTQVEKNTESESINLVVENNEEVIDLPSYYIEEVEDTSIGNCIRKTLHIVVTGEYNKDELYKIAEKEIKDYSTKNKINALVVGFYENAEKIGNGYEMGRVEYAPNGIWGNAMDVKAGDYTTFKIVNLIEDKLELPKGEDLQNGATDIEQIKNDFQEVMSGSSVEMNLTNGV
ncbi:MAG: hypothetical protein ACRDCW_03430, partial [Sarcina sp.]